MQTLVTNDAEEAARIVRNGGTCAFPTETVYGLGADIFSEHALAAIFEAKQRPADNPLIAHVSSIDQIGEVASLITPSAEKFIDNFFPGPLTVVLARSPRVPLIATAGLETIGVRMPSLETARRFLEFCRTPVAAPSANLSGRPSPTTWQAVYEDLNGRIAGILRGDAAEIGLESTVVDCTGEFPVLLRKGSVSLEQLRSVIPETSGFVPGNAMARRSPGLRHKHYAPKAIVRILDLEMVIDQGQANAFIGTREPDQPFVLSKLCSDVNEYAHSLFSFFRECDANRVAVIYCEPVPEDGIGAALMDRLRRAADAAISG